MSGNYYDASSTAASTRINIPQFDTGGLLSAGQVLGESLNYLRDREVADYKTAEEQRRYDEDRKWKLEDRERVAKERQAEDAYYGELAKGVQTKGGIYGDALATEANKYALNPDEILRATLYKNDANAARAAGDSTLADKLDWQTRVSDNVDSFMQSGVGEEARVEMYDRINSMVGGQGLPIPKEAILSADQARLAEKTATENAAKALKESKAEILKNDQANAWKYISALGNTSTIIDENGNEVQVSNSTRSSTSAGAKDLKDLSAGVSRISDAIKKANIDDKYIGTATDDALKARETLIARKNMTPDEASKLVADAIGSKDVGLIFTDNVPKFSEENLLKYADSQTRISNRAGIAADNTTSNINSKATQAANLSELLNAQSKTQLGSILEEQAKLAKGSEGRRADSVNAWLQNRGLLDKPKAVVETPAVDNQVGKLKVGGKSSKDVGFLQAVADVESGGDYNAKSNKSSAKGKYQFVDATLKNLIEGSGNDHTIDQVSANPELQEYYMDRLVKSNKKTLTSMGVPVNDFNMWLAHNLSPTSAKEFISGEPLSDKTINAIKQNLPDGFAPTRENYLERYGKKFDGAPTTIKEKTESDMDNIEDDSTPSSGILTKILDKVPASTDYKNGELVQKDNKPLLPNELTKTPVVSDTSSNDDYIKEVINNEKSKYQSSGDFLDLSSSKANTNLLQSGVSQKDIDRVKRELADKKRSDYLIADRNYRVSKRNGGTYDGKTTEEWDDLRSAKNKVGDYGWAAPVIAASGPLAGLFGSVAGGSAVAGEIGVGGTTLAGTTGRQILKETLSSNVNSKATSIVRGIDSAKVELERIRQLVLNAKNPPKDLIKKQDDLADYLVRAKQELDTIKKSKDTLNKLDIESSKSETQLVDLLNKLK